MDTVVTVPLPELAQNNGDKQLNTDVTVTRTNTTDSELSHTSRSANTPAAGESTPAAHGTAEVGGTTGNVDNPTDEDPTIDANTTLGDGRARIDCDGRAWFDVELAAAARSFPSKKNHFTYLCKSQWRQHSESSLEPCSHAHPLRKEIIPNN